MDSESVAYGCLKEGIFWEGGVDYGSVAYGGDEGVYILEGRLDSGRDVYLRGWGHILGGRGRFWEGGIDYFLAFHTVVEKGSIFWKEGIYFGSANLYKME